MGWECVEQKLKWCWDGSGWRQECSAGKEQAALKGKLEHGSSRQKNDTKLMNCDQFAVLLWGSDFGREGFGFLRMQIWNPECQSCDLSFGAIPPPQQQQSRAQLCSSQPFISSASAGSDSLQ